MSEGELRILEQGWRQRPKTDGHRAERAYPLRSQSNIAENVEKNRGALTTGEHRVTRRKNARKHSALSLSEFSQSRFVLAERGKLVSCFRCWRVSRRSARRSWSWCSRPVACRLRLRSARLLRLPRGC